MTTRKKKNSTKDESIIVSEQINQVPIGKLAEDAYIEFGGYINNFRHLANISDGVKVSYRRLIYTVLTKFPHTSLTHTNTAIAAVASIHPAGLAGFNDMCATLVKAGVFKGSGSFGYSQIDGVKNDPAADRYTSIAISDLYWGIMGDLIKEVPYVESPNGNPEPLFLPTPLPLCLSGDTKIRLADGRNLEISKLVEEFKSGKDNYVLSCSPDGDFRMSKVIWGDKTKESNKFIRITLDNGEIIDSTEDHLFMMRSGDYVKAGELREGDSLMPGYFSYNSGKRECIKNNYSLNNVPIYHLANMYNIEHEIYEDDPEKIAIHHVDKNKDNNNPTNIIKLTRKEHSEAHREEFIKMVNDPEIRARIKESNKKYWEDPINHILAKRRWEETGDIPLENGKTRREISRETRISYNKSEKGRENIRNFWKEDSERAANYREKMHDMLVERNSDPEFQKHAAEQRRQWLKTEEGKEFSKKHAEKLRKRNSDPEFQKKTVRGRILSHFKRLINKEGLTFDDAYKKLEDKIEKWFDSKEDFIEKEKTYNHKVVKIERVSEESSRDFYDITVDSRYHNFLLSAGVVVHNCLQLKTISQGLGVGISTIYPNFSPWSLYQAYKHNNPNLLEPNVDLILDKKNSELKKLWETGQGRVIYAYKISRYTNPETGLEGILFETKDGTEIFTPKLKPLRKLEEDGKIYIEDLTDYESCKMAVYRIPGARGVSVDDIEALCRKCCFSSTTFNLNVTDAKSAFRIPLYAWIDFTYKRYIDLVTKANQRKIKKTEFDIAVFEAIPIVANYILNINPKATDKELVTKLGMPLEIVTTVLGKPISYLRKNSDTTGKVKELKAKLKELKKFNPITYTEEIIKRL